MKTSTFSAGLVTLAFLAAAILPFTQTKIVHAANIDTTPDCDKFAVMYCGSSTKNDVLDKLQNGDTKNSASDIQKIFSQFGLNASRIQADNFVKGVVFQNGEVRVGNKVVATGAITYIRTMGRVNVDKMGSAQEALVHINSNGQFEYAIMTPCGNPVTAKPVAPQKLECTSLQATVSNRTKVTLINKVLASGGATASSVRYNFSDGTVKTVTPNSSSTYTFDKAGNYTVKATVVGTLNGNATEKTASACAATFSVKELPANPNYTCEILTKKPLGNRKYEFTAKASATNGATVKDITIAFGENSAKVTVPNNGSASYTYTKAGQYTARATANIALPNKTSTTVTSTDCTVVIDEPETPVTPPKELPTTGAGGLAALFTTTSIAGGLGFRAWTLRRLNR